MDSLKRNRRIAIVGLPNTGKSLTFNNLTGEYNIVANYPLSTIEVKQSTCKIGNETYDVIDTPGLQSLYIHSEEELVVRDLLLSSEVDVVVQCVDANRLKQSLSLTVDLMELGIPLVISLNAVDETANKGIWIDAQKLSLLLEVPVVEQIAISRIGTNRLKESIRRAKKSGKTIYYGDLIEGGIARLESLLYKDDKYGRKISRLLLLEEPYIIEYIHKNYDTLHMSKIMEEISGLKQQFARGNLLRIINDKYAGWIDDISSQVIKQHTLTFERKSMKFSALSRNPVTGVPILFMILYIMYLLIVDVATAIAGWMEHWLWLPTEGYLTDVISNQLLKEFLIGDYGLLSLGLANALITVLPILSVFFLFYNVLEDVGYIPNLSILTKRIFNKFGLSGSAIMPIVLGFGCKTMATLTTKCLHSKKEKYIAVFLIAMTIPCASQLGLNMNILGRIGPTAFFIAFTTLIFIAVSAGLSLNRLLKEECKSGYIQELPSLRIPNVRAVVKKTYYRLYWFLEEAVPVFILAALVLFALEKLGLLNAMKVVLAPAIQGYLGLPLDMVDAVLLTFARHEAAAAMIINLIEKGKLDYIQCIVAVIFTTTFIPCFANIGAMVKELGLRTALITIFAINSASFIIAGALNRLLVYVL